MKLQPLILSVLVIAPFAWAVSQDDVASRDLADPTERQRIARELEIRNRPGEEHTELGRWVGEWDVEVRLFPGTRQAKPFRFEGTCTNEMVLGGRFLESRLTAGQNIMKQEFRHLLGFDRRHERFEQIRMDTMGTHTTRAFGLFDEEAKTLTLDSEQLNPVSGLVERNQWIATFVDDDHYLTQLVVGAGSMGNEEEFLMLEVEYTRVAAN